MSAGVDSGGERGGTRRWACVRVAADDVISFVDKWPPVPGDRVRVCMSDMSGVRVGVSVLTLHECSSCAVGEERAA